MIAQLHGRREDVEYGEGTNFRLYHNDLNESYPPHWHTSYEIVMPLEETYTVIIDSHNIQLAPEDILIIPSGVMHELIAPPKGSRLIYLADYALTREVNGFDSVSNQFFPYALYRRGEGIEQEAEMRKALLQIELEYMQAEPLYEASIHALLLQFFILACRARLHQSDTFVGIRPQKQQAYIDTFFNICSYINDHCTEELRLDQLAEMSGFSKSHFIRLFKDYTGVSYYEYLTRRRMLNVELLLNNPEYSISDVAMRSGYDSIATFNRVFKTSHGVTPTEYRKRLRLGH
ncbi:MAG: helix-turn-helix domain-containing protein [Lachnospiraceae bacterium]|nr:helix-turn-helix domain-containing protein [Lachnospiraceae bacterium]